MISDWSGFSNQFDRFPQNILIQIDIALRRADALMSGQLGQHANTDTFVRKLSYKRAPAAMRCGCI